jgi:hypothetical protein
MIKTGGGQGMGNLKQWRVLAPIAALLLVLVGSLGCAGSQANAKNSEEEGQAAAAPANVPAPLYYDFEDVLVPSELTINKGKTFIYHVPDFRAGVLVLKGRVQIDSLIRFFENNMARDNWRLLSSFKAARTIMFFNKPNRSCIISITEGTFYSDVEIWVVPTLEHSEQYPLK